MQRCLVRTKVDSDILICKSLPKVYYIALICDGNDFLVCYSLTDTWYEFVKVGMNLVYPSLTMSLVCGMWIYLSTYTYDA